MKYLFTLLVLTGCVEVPKNTHLSLDENNARFKSRLAAIDRSPRLSYQDQLDDLILQSQQIQMDVGAAQIDQAQWVANHPWY